MIDRSSFAALIWAVAKPRGYYRYRSAIYKEAGEITGAVSYRKPSWSAGIDVWVGMQFTSFVAARIPPHDAFWAICAHARSLGAELCNPFDGLCMRNDDTCTIASLREPIERLLDWCEEHIINIEVLKCDLRSEASWTLPAMKIKELWPWIETGIVPPPDEVYLKGR